MNGLWNIFKECPWHGIYGVNEVSVVNAVGMTDFVAQDFNPGLKSHLQTNAVGMADKAGMLISLKVMEEMSLL